MGAATVKRDAYSTGTTRVPGRLTSVGGFWNTCARVVWAAGVWALLCAGGCQEVNRVEPVLSAYHARGDFAGAAAYLDSDATRKVFGERSKLLWDLERGSVAQAMHDTNAAVAHLNEAEAASGYNYDASQGDVLVKWTINDAESNYVAQPYEDVYTNVLKQLAYLEEGKIQGFATAESLRVLNKAEHLRDVYQQYMSMSKRDDSAGVLKTADHARQAQPKKAGQFVESPLGAYLAAVTFMEAGDRNNHELAARRLTDAIESQKDYIGNVNPAAFEGLDKVAREDVNVLVVGLAGRGPVREEGRLTFPVVDAILTIPYPRLAVFHSGVEGAELEVEGATSGHLQLVEDLSQVAAENYRRAEPAMYSRTVARVAGKLAAVAGAAVAVNSAERKKDSNILTIATVAVGAIAVQASEKADLRSWVFLPGQAYVALLKLPPGEHRVRLVYRLAGGGRVEQPWQQITVPERGLKTVVGRYPG